MWYYTTPFKKILCILITFYTNSTIKIDKWLLIIINVLTKEKQ